MTLDLHECALFGPALPEPFVHFELLPLLAKQGLLPKAPGRKFEQGWGAVRRQLRALGGAGGPQRVHNHVIAPLAAALGYDAPVRQDEAATREGLEDGGWRLQARGGAHLRAWSVAVDTDLDAPRRSGRAYRFSATRSAQRVLLAGNERAGLLTNGEELRLLLCDPARPDSHLAIPLAGSAGWRQQNLAPDSYRVLLALAGPKGLAALPAVLDAARLSQARVTKELRVQARHAVEAFVQALLDHPANAGALDRLRDRKRLAATLWQEALVLVYRLLFTLKLESAADTARAFSFASTSLWRTAFSPNRALGPLVRRHLDLAHDTGRMLEDGLRGIFRVFRDGLSCSELSIAPLGGALFGAETTKLLDGLVWGERAAALLLDRLLWTLPKGRGRERVHYGSLDVEDLGRVYEALLELEPGITAEPMARLRRGKLEVVVPVHRAARYRRVMDADDAEEEAAPYGRTHVAWVEDIPAGRFFLRVGMGRKATGSYYTPQAFVRFLVRETLAPRIGRSSPDSDPNPGAILALRVVDPAAGSGHFLVEACRYLGEALYAACRLCDEQAVAAEAEATGATQADRARLLSRAEALRRRLADLPDPDGSLLAYLPSRAIEGGDSGVSQSRALAICRRLVAVHCLYGVDRNPLAVELAKLSLWLESYAEGLPLTFLDHRLVQGDSLAGPFFMQLSTLPVRAGELDPLLARGVAARLAAALHAALREVKALEASVGRDAADLVLKRRAKARLDAALQPLRQLARAWSGAAMSGACEADDEWLALARTVAETGVWPDLLTKRQAAMLGSGELALPWDLVFPEVFCPDGTGGFDAVLSNPPWDIMQANAKEFLAGFDLSILDTRTTHESRVAQERLLADAAATKAFRHYQQIFAQRNRVVEKLYLHQKVDVGGEPTGGKPDLYRVFAERMLQLLGQGGGVGMVVPSAFHANEGATGVRRLYLQQTHVEWCLSFENRHRLFDIHARCKFALVVARRQGPTQAIRCGFYLTELAQIEEVSRVMRYDRAFIAASGGAHATFLELRGAADLGVARRMFAAPQSFAAWTDAHGIALSREANMTDDAERFTSVARLVPAGGSATNPAVAEKLRRGGYLVLHEGKTIHQYCDRWETPPRYAIGTDRLADRPRFLENTRYFRAACREIASATNERTAIAAMLPPGVICGHTINVERVPSRRPNASALFLLGIMNSFAFDWLLRQKSASHVSLYILADVPCPRLAPDAERFLAHASLRLSCNHGGFVPLWREQLGGAWREGARRSPWPVIAEDAARWKLRATMDAVVADAYGLNRADYARILAGFSHRRFPRAPALCLAAFDALAANGIRAFCKKNDPYHDVPLVASLARPVITLRGETPTLLPRRLLPAAPAAG